MLASFADTEVANACDLCGGAVIATEDAAANLVRCTTCGYRFVSPRPTQEAIAASYSASNFYDGWIADDSGRRQMWSKRLSLFRNLGRGVRVLDIGAGIGTFLAMARDEMGWEVTGTEVSSSAVRLAHERHGLDLLTGHAQELDLPSGYFDLITLWHVLEHVPSPSQTLTLCHRLLRPKGHLAIAVPNDNDERWWLVKAKARLKRSAPPPRYESLQPGHEVHLSQFQTRILKRALEARGFTVEAGTVDDHYAQPTARSKALVTAYRLINSAVRLNFAQAAFLLARKTS